MSFETSPNPHHLYRDPDNGVILGVCAGFADYFGWERRTLRIAVAISAIFFLPQVLVVYVLAAIFMKRKPSPVYGTGEEAVFWRAVSMRPADTFSSLRYRFRTLEDRLVRLEKHVTSKEYKLNRDFRDLEGR
ncbi:phage shock protein C (PspC) family protein [Dongia mobilis]|uniref:Phage shock protein C (PspC) family protein n=1 Tax=Dongia mobilis TaxID=578943 RepID=A0A4V3DEP0_9PROT|nr:envelope stress response membrane protein PspC [Dongia mobilis]TDQ82458.1 phage shock protein C (PspC) family protein [Dongia mobilis]